MIPIIDIDEEKNDWGHAKNEEMIQIDGQADIRDGQAGQTFCIEQS